MCRWGSCSCCCSSRAAGPAGCCICLGLALLGGRLAHAWSFSAAELRLPSRTAGMVLTMGMLAVAALLCLLQGLGLA